jgi:hypothetical protein
MCWRRFLSTTQSTVPDLKKALHADAYLKVWGCSATTYHRVAISAAYPKEKAGVAQTEPFEVAWQFFDHSRPPKLTGSNRARLTLAHVRHRIATQCSGKSYCSAAAKFLGLPVWGAPPGLGSNFAGRPLKVDTNGAVFGYLKVLFGDAAWRPFVGLRASLLPGLKSYGAGPAVGLRFALPAGLVGLTELGADYFFISRDDRYRLALTAQAGLGFDFRLQ